MNKQFTVLISLALALSVAGCSPQPNAPPTPQSLGQVEQKSGVEAAAVTVTKVVDGDTVHVTLNGKDESVRVIGANSPELSHPQQRINEQPYGKQAKEYTTRALLNKQVYLEFDVGQRDKYRRVLAYIWLEQPRNNSESEVRVKMFNARLLLDGYAQVMTVPPNVKYADMFKDFEREARDNGRGLWSIRGEKPNDRYKK